MTGTKGGDCLVRPRGWSGYGDGDLRRAAGQGAAVALLWGVGFTVLQGVGRGVVFGIILGLLRLVLELLWPARKRPGLSAPVKLALVLLPFVALILVAVAT